MSVSLRSHSPCRPRSFRWVLSALAALLCTLVSAQETSVTLNGNYLRVSVDPSGGLINNSASNGIAYDPNGGGSFSNLDFLKPGDPFEFYSVGYGGATWVDAGLDNGNPFNATTVISTSGSLLSATTTSTTNFGLLSLSQIVSYDVNSRNLSFSVTLTNTGTGALSDVVYARGFDPDQDANTTAGIFDTQNNITGSNLIQAFGTVTGWTIGIFSNSSYSHTPSTRVDWNTNPYTLLTGSDISNNNYSDSAINMAWLIGNLAGGASANIQFEYQVFGPIPEPSTYALLAGAAMLATAAWRRRRISGGA